MRVFRDRIEGGRALGELLAAARWRGAAIDHLAAAGGETSMALFLPGQDPNGRLDSLLVHARDFSAGGASPS